MNRLDQFYTHDHSDIEIAPPILINDFLAKQWLEINYVFNSDFAPGKTIGIGEIAAQIIVNPRAKTTEFVISGEAIKKNIQTFKAIRTIEDLYLGWLPKIEPLKARAAKLTSQLEQFIPGHQLAKHKEMMGQLFASLDGLYLGAPTKEAAQYLYKLGILLQNTPHTELLREIMDFYQEIGNYLCIFAKIKDTKYYFGTIPFISSQGMIYVVHPYIKQLKILYPHIFLSAYQDNLPTSAAFLRLVALQKINKEKLFLTQMQDIVNRDDLVDAEKLYAAKVQVFQSQSESLLRECLVGLKINFNKSQDEKLCIAPIISHSMYQKHLAYFEKSNLVPEELVITQMVIDMGLYYLDQYDEVARIKLIHAVTKL